MQDCPRMIEDAREALRTSDVQKLKCAAHSLKGAVGILGGKATFEAALRLETIGAAAIWLRPRRRGRLWSTPWSSCCA